VAFGNNNIQDLIWAIVSITTGILWVPLFARRKDLMGCGLNSSRAVRKKGSRAMD
jgi:hypothetical protein